jgi:hypothetical protein
LIHLKKLLSLMMVQLVLFVELRRRLTSHHHLPLLVSLWTLIFLPTLTTTTTTTFVGVQVLMSGPTGLVVLVSSCRLEWFLKK